DGQSRRWIYVRGVVPGGPDVEMVMPAEAAQQPGEVTGRVVDTGNRLMGRTPEIRVSAFTRSSPAQLNGDRFTASEMSPGRYFVWVQADGEPVAVGTAFELQSGQKLDIGDVVTEPGGTLRIA